MKISILTFMFGMSLGLGHAIASTCVTGVNVYCDPAGTFYAGGTPLFDEATGISISKLEYLALKGLNEYCDPMDVVYAGGTPLYNEETGETTPLETYLETKEVCY